MAQANSFSLSELSDFEKTFKPAVKPAVLEATTNSESIESQPSASEGENQPVESLTTDPANSDVSVESSDAESTTADVSDASDPADMPSEQADTQQQKPRSRAQARIEDLVASNKALKASLEYMQNEVLAKLPQVQQPIEQPTAVTPVITEDAPTLESCEFDTAKWTKAMHAWTQKQIDAGVNRAVQTVAQNQTEATRRAAFETRMTAAAAAIPDLQVVLSNPALPQITNKDTAALIVDSPVGPQILYHLAKNPEKATRLVRQSPAQQAAAIGRLEAEITAQAAAPKSKQKTPNNITRAPNPPNPTSGRGNTPSVDPNKMSAKDWIEWDRKQTEARQQARKAR
jgi:hypothetical protein